MKLRILGNSLRFRLSAEEVRDLQREGRLTDRIRFDDNAALAYTIEVSSNLDSARVSFDGKQIRVDLAESLAETWGEEREVGFHEVLETPGGPLELLIEKDRRP